MSGATIRTGSVVGAYSVVSGSFEPYSIIAGNPGRIVRKRFDDRKIEILLKSKWWTWDLDFINQNRHIVFSEDFSLFEDLVSSLDNDKSF
jgi:virginiamycin A acetyltransferase